MTALKMISPRFFRALHGRRASTLSVVQGASYPPLDNRTLSNFFVQEILHNHSTRPALICPSEKVGAHGGPISRNLGRVSHLAWDFEEFWRHIDAVSRGLLLLGVQKGDVISVIMGNNSAYAILQWAAARIGAILATINPSYHIDELASTLKLVGTKHLVIMPVLRRTQYLKSLITRFPGLASSRPGNIQESELPELRNLIVVNNPPHKHDLVGPAIDWQEMILWGEHTREARLVKDIAEGLHNDEIINLQFTSGTTGAPKAVSLTHHNLLNNAIFIGRSMNIDKKDILCNVPPLFHCFGLVLGNLAFWSHSACVVYPSASFDPAAIVNALTKEHCTALHGVPTHFLGVLSEVTRKRGLGEEVDLSNLRTGIAAGTSVPIDLMRRLITELNLRDLTNAYGMTETSPVSFQTTPADPLINRVETVGKILPHVKAKIIDPQGKIVPVGTSGQVCVAGYLLQKGYWNDEEHTNRVAYKDVGDDSDTVWMHTGDEGILDEEGYLRIVGRMKDVIIRGGENLFPVQIENVLVANTLVREAAVVAVPDEEYGEVVGAWIVRDADSNTREKLSREDVRKIVRDTMNPQCSPAWVWFVGEDGTSQDLPKTASGKVMKHILRKWSKELAEAGVGRVKS